MRSLAVLALLLVAGCTGQIITNGGGGPSGDDDDGPGPGPGRPDAGPPPGPGDPDANVPPEPEEPDADVPPEPEEPDAAVPPTNPELEWKRANLTNFTSYPEPGSDECDNFNGCMWAGQFAFVNGQQTEEWVSMHNIVAVHERDANEYKLKTLRLRQDGHELDVKVYDECSDSDCSGCCTNNANRGGVGFLIDIESYTMERFGSGDGVVEFACLDCD